MGLTTSTQDMHLSDALESPTGQLHELEHFELLREPCCCFVGDALAVPDAVEPPLGRRGQEGGRRRLQDLQVGIQRLN